MNAGASPSVVDVKRDVKRTLQVFLPTVPGPVLDFAATTVFASLSTSSGSGKGTPQGPQSGGFVLRRLSSGDHGQFDLADPLPPPRSRRLKGGSIDFSDPSCLGSFDWNPSPPLHQQQRRTSRRASNDSRMMHSRAPSTASSSSIHTPALGSSPLPGLGVLALQSPFATFNSPRGPSSDH